MEIEIRNKYNTTFKDLKYGDFFIIGNENAVYIKTPSHYNLGLEMHNAIMFGDTVLCVPVHEDCPVKKCSLDNIGVTVI